MREVRQEGGGIVRGTGAGQSSEGGLTIEAVRA